MEFRILGPLEVVADGRPVPVGRGLRRSLLGLLLLHRNELVGVAQIVDALWGEQPPPRVRTALQNQVWHLRTILGPARIETGNLGYLLRLGPDELDLDRFERLCAAGQLEEGLALWRGPPLADLANEPWAQGEIARLEDMRLAALEDRIDGDLAAGRHAALVGQLHAHVAEHPLRERLRAQLMLALYRSARQAEALEAYREGRRMLVDELGIEPSAELRRLERAILAQEPGLRAPEPERAGSASPAIRGDALPVHPTSFVGRIAELDELQQLVHRPDVRLLTLTGPGGAGKTRLALELARRLEGRFDDGVCFVDLAAIREPDLVAGALADRLGLREVSPRDAPEALGSYLRERSVLLLLDNFEQVLDARTLVSELLESTSALELLVTSRAPLRLAAEHAYSVPPLGLPDNETDLERLVQAEAIALFAERARAARPEFALTEANANAVVALCTSLDGLPLALELAAARVAILSPRAILERLGHWLDLLKSRIPDVPPRHRTLRATIDWSYELLPPEQRKLLAALGVFVGGFTADAADAVTAWDEVDALDGVEALREASLLRDDLVTGDEPRFGMLEPIHEYALELLDGRDDANEIRRRHAVYYRALAEHAEPELCGRGQEEWLERLDADHGNLRAALAWSGEGGDREVGLRLGAALWRYWQIRGLVVEGQATLERLLRTRAGSRAARAAAQLSVARSAFVQGDFPTVERSAEASLPVHRRLGDDRSVSFALALLGLAAEVRGDNERARELLDEAREVARRAEDTWGESRCLCYLGQLKARAGDLTTAKRLLEEGLRGTREVEDARGVAWVLASLAGVALAARDPDRARPLLEEALRLDREIGDTWGISHQLEMLGSMSIDAGDHAAAERLLVESLAVARDANYRPLMAAVLESLARLAFARGRVERATCLSGCASVLRERVAVHPMQVGRVDHARDVDAMRPALSDDAFAEAWARGRAMTLDDALAYATAEE